MGNAVGTRAAGGCFHSISGNTEYMFSISFREHCDEKKENNLLTLIIKMYINIILFARTIITSTACASTVFPLSYRNKILNQSVCVFSNS